METKKPQNQIRSGERVCLISNSDPNLTIYESTLGFAVRIADKICITTVAVSTAGHVDQEVFLLPQRRFIGKIILMYENLAFIELVPEVMWDDSRVGDFASSVHVGEGLRMLKEDGHVEGAVNAIYPSQSMIVVESAAPLQRGEAGSLWVDNEGHPAAIVIGANRSSPGLTIAISVAGCHGIWQPVSSATSVASLDDVGLIASEAYADTEPESIISELSSDTLAVSEASADDRGYSSYCWQVDNVEAQQMLFACLERNRQQLMQIPGVRSVIAVPTHLPLDFNGWTTEDDYLREYLRIEVAFDSTADGYTVWQSLQQRFGLYPAVEGFPIGIVNSAVEKATKVSWLTKFLRFCCCFRRCSYAAQPPHTMYSGAALQIRLCGCCPESAGTYGGPAKDALSLNTVGITCDHCVDNAAIPAATLDAGETTAFEVLRRNAQCDSVALLPLPHVQLPMRTVGGRVLNPGAYPATVE
eukprot:TRINITY_DN14658_c0_g1_i1.p1 TRINITY_DN14658_c0_g1~~TRINITY_DN14658_c0_g1_i1.p1  ORF type:complete len:488 (+),score=57.77 TRINITY_DN14658_c0_g1_i1:53-1465(+)